MAYRQQLKFFVVSMATVSMVVAVTAIAIFDHFQIKQQQARLQKITENKAAWINSLIQSPNMSNLTQGGKEQAILKILSQPHQSFPALATTGEFTLGKRQGNSIVFLLSLRYQQETGIQSIPWESDLAKPAKRALEGKSGTIIAKDYSGQRVIAAYQPIEELDWSIVAKVNLKEIRFNLLYPSLFIIGLTIIANGFTFILVKPIFRKLELSEKQNKEFMETLESKVIQRTEELAENEERLKAIFENSAIGILITTIEGKIIKVNQFFQGLIDYSETELTQLNLSDLIDLDDLLIDSELQSDLLQNKHEFLVIEKPLHRKNDSWIWAKLIFTLGYNFKNEPQFLIVMVNDITQKKESEQIKENLLRRNQSLIQSLGEIVYEHLIPEDIIYWDGNYTELLGYSAKEMGNNEDSWLSKVHPDDLQRVVTELDEAFAQNRLYNLEYRIRHKKGYYLWFHDSGVMYGNADNQLQQVIGILRNITLRKEAEQMLIDTNEKYQTILTQTLEGFFIVDQKGHLLEVNDAYCQMIGYTKEELLKMTLEDIEAIENPEMIKQHIAKVILFKNDMFETKHRCKDGSIINVEISSNYIKSYQCFYCFIRNITQRKLAVQELEMSKRKYQRLVDNIGDKFVIYSHTTPTGILTYVSGGIKTVFGLEVEDVLNKPWFEIINWQEGEIEKGLDYETKLMGNSQSLQQFEMNFINLQGIKKTVMISEHLSKDQEGNVIAIEGIAEDITERKQAEVALLESEIKFRTLVQTAGTIIIVLSPDYKILEWNIEAERIYGYSRNQVLNQDYLALCLLPEDKEQVTQELKKTLAEEVMRNFEHLVLTKEGQTRYILWNLSSFADTTGKVIGIAKVGQDITERKQTEIALQESEQKLRTLIDYTYDWEYWIDPQGQLVYISPSCERITGYSPQLFYQDPNLLKTIIHPDDLKKLEKYSSRTKNTRKVYRLDFRIINYSGEVCWIAHTCHSIYNLQGEYLGIRVSNRDISDRKQTEAKLQEVNQELQRVNKQLQDSNNDLIKQNKDMQLLDKLNDFLQACLTLEEAYLALADLIQPLFPQSSGAIYLIESHNIVHPITTWGKPLYSQTTFTHHDCWALRRGQLHYVDSQHPNLFCKHISHHHPSLQSLCVPMMAQGKTIGLVYIEILTKDPTQTPLTEQKQKLAKTIAEQLSLSLANLNLRETLQNQSIKDPLTGLFNRRYMEEFLTREFYYAQRKGYSIGIMMLDIDHFKSFNDNFGHDAGDAVLREIGSFLLDNIRGSDIACRYGGEELILILPEADLENTKKRAETIRKGIKKLPVKSQGKLLNIVTTSIGVACFPQHGTTFEDVIQAADQALYQAKESGRDCVKDSPTH